MTQQAARPLKIAVLIKQIPRTDQLDMTPDGRLRRDGVATELNPYCRRALAKGVELARQTGGQCHAYSMGPETAAEVLREAMAAGADRGVLLSDSLFAGADTLATSRCLAAALRLDAPYDLVLTGLNSVDADTGQVPPQLAELLGWPFLGSVRQLNLSAAGCSAWLEQENRGIAVEFDLPCVISTAERLCDPAKPPPELITAVPVERVEKLSAAQLGAGAWGQNASRTRVGVMQRVTPPRRCRLRFDGTDVLAVDQAVCRLMDWGVFEPSEDQAQAGTDIMNPASVPCVVVIEPGGWEAGRALCARAAQLSSAVVAVIPDSNGAHAELAGLDVQRAVLLEQVTLPEDVARGLQQWLIRNTPDEVILLGPASQWGRHVLSRLAVATDSGLTADATGLQLDSGGRLVAVKPSFCGKLNAAIHALSPLQMATVREGIFHDLLAFPRTARAPVTVEHFPVARQPAGVRITRIEQLDSNFNPYAHPVLIGLGQGVSPDAYAELEGLKSMLDAEFVATRKVTDHGWMPRDRQVGLTGRTIAPRLYLAIGLGGRPYHMVSVQQSRWIVAINNDPRAAVHDYADISLVGDWQTTIRLLDNSIRHRLGYA